MKYAPDFSSHFRILKGGKISLVVSALLISNADTYADQTISAPQTNQVTVSTSENVTLNGGGSVTVDGSGTQYGIYLNNTNLDNGKTITVGSNTSIDVNSSDDTAYAIASDIGFGIESGHILNSGTIAVTGVNNASGIYIANQNGTITNTGTIEATSTDPYGSAMGIQINGTASGTIMNDSNATIRVSSVYRAWGINSDLYDEQTIINNGRIEVSSLNYRATGIDIDDFNGSITNNGTITANTTTGGKSAGLFLASRAGSTNGVFTNNDTVIATVNNISDYFGYAIRGGNNGGNFTVINSSTGILNGNLGVYGVLNNFGAIELPWNANSDYVEAFVKNFVNKNGAQLTINLKNDGNIYSSTVDNHYSKLTTDTAVIEDGSIINVKLSDNNSNAIAGQRMNNVITATNTLTINPNQVNVTDNSAMLNFSIIDDANSVQDNTLDLLISAAQASNGGTGYEAHAIDGGGNSPSQRSGRLLDHVVASNNNTMNALFTALNSLGTNADVAHATSALAPVATTASVQAGNQVANNIQNIVELRQNVSMGGGLNSGDMLLADTNLWVKPFATRGNQDDKDGFNGFDLKAKGFGIGMDKKYNDHQFGLALFVTDADVAVNHVSQNAALDVYTALVYGSTPVIDSETLFMYQAGYAWQKTKTTRNFNFGGLNETAHADFASKTASLDLKLARNYKVNQSLLLRPITELTYRNYQTPSYSETGASTTNQSFASTSSSEMILSFGTMFDYAIDKHTKVIGNVNVGYDLKNDQQSITYSYVGDASGASESSTGIDNGRWEYKAGIGIERTIDDGSNINIMIDHKQEGTTFTSNTISAKYVYKF